MHLRHIRLACTYVLPHPSPTPKTSHDQILNFGTVYIVSLNMVCHNRLHHHHDTHTDHKRGKKIQDVQDVLMTKAFVCSRLYLKRYVGTPLIYILLSEESKKVKVSA